jgi:hypothetical protein
MKKLKKEARAINFRLQVLFWYRSRIAKPNENREKNRSSVKHARNILKTSQNMFAFLENIQ